MVKKMSQSIEKLPPPNLVEPRSRVLEKIQKQIELGQLLRKAQITSQVELNEARAAKSKWRKYNEELLLRLFDNSTMADEYTRTYGSVLSWDPSLVELINIYWEDLDDQITRLEAIRDRLDLIPEKSISIVSTPNLLASSEMSGQDVFVVHGHDDAIKEAVSRFIEKLGFKPIILHEQPNAGRTVIEKFEDYSNVGFAIVLLTPDDICGTPDKVNDFKPRARQNVILELGYFFAKLGRHRVCALYKEDVELPSDIHGVLYTPLDVAGAWRLALAKEMKYAGYPVDMNKAL